MKLSYLTLSTVIGMGLVASVTVPATAISTDEVKNINSLKVAPENRSGYARSKFPSLTVGGCDTRARVLKQENKGTLRYKPGTCTVVSGKWYSPWDAKWHYSASGVQVDHTVALAEAWDSGARTWTTAKRKSYANELSSTWTLNTTTSLLNAQKSDKDAASWVPARNGCLYIQEQIGIKKRWGLSVDPVEKAALLKWARKWC